MNKQQRELFAKIYRLFSLSELEQICFDLGVDYEDIEGDARIDRARNLVRYFDRRGRLAELEAHCKAMRSTNWETESKPTSVVTTRDPETQAKRRTSYESLYRLLKPFARYDRSDELSKTKLEEISKQMRDWYFDVGGLYLSDDCREAYFALKEEIATAISESAPAVPDAKRLISKASILRAHLREDLA